MVNPRPCCGSDHTGPEHGADCALPHESERDAMLAYLATELLGWKYHDEAAYDDPQDGGKYLGRCQYYTKGRRVPNLDELLTGDGMRAVIEKMAERGIDRFEIFAVATTNPEHAWQAAMKSPWMEGYANAGTVTEAVARAAYAALKAEL